MSRVDRHDEAAAVWDDRGDGRGRGGWRLALVLLVLVAACTSTNAPRSAAPGAPASGSATASPDSPIPPSLAAAPGDSETVATAGDGQTATGSAPQIATGAPSQGGPAVLSGAGGTAVCPIPARQGAPGITDQEIAVGVPRFTNVAAVATGLEPSEAELEEYVEVMVAHLNATGGVACRQVRVVWHDIDVADRTVLIASMEQAMCATWTQDHQVFAAFPGPYSGPYDVLYPCLDRAGVAIIDVQGVSYRDAEGFAEVPRLLAVNSPRLDRGTEAQIHAFVRQGFLTAESRIGVVHYDDPRLTRTVDETLIPALSAHGLALTERRAITVPSRPADPDRDRDLANAALQFKLAEVDRVVFVRGPSMAAGFMNAAEGNRYHPRYGLTTAEMAAIQAGVPEAQLVGARGIGWVPEADLVPRRPDTWPARTACLDFFQQRGFRTATTLDRFYALSVCEGLWFLQAAVQAAPRPLTADALVAGATALHTGYESASVEWTRFGPARRDGAATYRDAAYDKDCGCFTYIGGPRQLP